MGDLLPPHCHFTQSDGRFGDPLSPYVALGNAHTCALSYRWGNQLGVVQCWGAGDAGQLGRGESVDRGGAPGDAYPVIDLGTNKWVAIRAAGAMYASGGDHTCAVVQDSSDALGTPLAGSLPTQVKCWGKNDKGQLGLGDQTNRGDQPGEMGDALALVRLR